MDKLDFTEKKVQVIDLDILKRTFKENDVFGKPKAGIYHFDLIEGFIDEAKSLNYDVEVYDMFAADNKDKMATGVSRLPELEEKYGEKAVEAHLLRRVFTNMRIKDFDDDERTTNLAISYHQQGIQVGFGNMVMICHNQQMLHPDMYASTYCEKGRKGDKMKLEDVIKTAFGWLRDAKDIIHIERDKIERMKRIQVTMEETLKFLGLLLATRVAVDSNDKSIHQNVQYPLNCTQINEYTENVLKKYEFSRVHSDGLLSVFDLYDCATDLYKANRMEIPNMLPQNRAMASMLNDHFAI